MKNVYYCSSMHSDKYPSNSRSKFTSSFHEDNLEFSDDDPLEVCVKSIIFDSKVSHSDIESKSDIPDIILINKVSKLETSIFDILQTGYDVAYIPIPSDHKILKYNENWSYVFDAQEQINEFGMRSFIVTNFHKGFTSANFILNDKEHWIIFQLIYIKKTKFESFFEFKTWYNTIYENVTFKFKESEESKVYFGENLLKHLSIVPGTEISKVERLIHLLEIPSDILEENTNNIHEIGKMLLMKIINYRYFKISANKLLFSEENLLKPLLLGLKSDFCKHSIRNSTYDQVVAVIDNSSNKNIKEIEFKNPVFYQTTKEKLSNATFEIFDFDTGKQPNFDIGSPTIVNCLVRKMKEHEQPSFSVLLDSSCKDSGLIHNNTPMNFRVKLAERLFLPENWGVSLKSLFMTTDLYNVSPDKFYFSYSEELKQKELISEWYDKYTSTGVTVNTDGDDGVVSFHPIESSRVPDRYVVDQNDWEYEYKFTDTPLPSGCYKSPSQLIDVLQKSFDDNHVRLNIRIEDGKKLIISLKEDVVGGKFRISFSPYLSYTLGLTNSLEKSFDYSFTSTNPYQTHVEPKLHMLNPKYLFVCCNIVDDTMFSGENVKLLRLLVNVEGNQYKIMNFDFLNPDIKDLKIREFSSIHITITDVSGEPLMTDSLMPTILQLEFLSQ